MNREKPDSFQELVQSWKNGNRESAGLLLASYYDALVQNAAWILAKAPDVDPGLEPSDLVHDVYWEILRQRNLEFESAEHFLNRVRLLMIQVFYAKIRYAKAHKRNHGRVDVPFSSLNTDC